MSNKVLITSALPYANGPLHFGHIAGAYLPGDCYARFERLLKKDVLYICGSDEYGVAITMSADKAGRQPQEHVDIYHEVIRSFFEKLNMSFDHYSRTTWKGHYEPVQQYFLDLLANGFIEEQMTEQLYSATDDKFLADRYVVGTCPRCGFDNARGDECQKCGASYEATDLIHPRSKLTNAALVLKSTKHWFLMLNKFKDRLLQWLDTKDWKPNVVNYVRGYVEELRPRAITRDSTWGVPIPLPNTEGKVLYVWFDAPIGYISATKDWAETIGDTDRWKNYWCDPETKLVNFIGKDNILFHAVIFPAMTMGQNHPFKLVDELPANEFFNLEGRQFSKSDGWYVDLDTFFQTYSTDQIRYTIAANAPETADSEFNWKDFQMRCNTELLGKFGNLVNRVLVFAKTHCQGAVPSSGQLQEVDNHFLSEIKRIVAEAKESYAAFKVRHASQLVMELSQLGNVYFDAKRPWTDAKKPETRHVMETTIACCLKCLQAMALISFPIIPESASKIWKMLGYTKEIQEMGWDAIMLEEIAQGQKLTDPQILFKRVEDIQIQHEIEKLHKMSQEHVVSAKSVETKPVDYIPLKEAVNIDDVQRLDLRVGSIVSAEAVPKSKKLLKLQVDLGFEMRTVVSGISLSYKPEDIIGKKVVIVANLQPATLMGIQSQGMILAGSWSKDLELLSIQHLPNGSVVS